MFFFVFVFFSERAARRGGEGAARLFIFIFFPCSVDHERDWPLYKVPGSFFRAGNQPAECEKQQQQQQLLVCENAINRSINQSINQWRYGWRTHARNTKTGHSLLQYYNILVLLVVEKVSKTIQNICSSSSSIRWFFSVLKFVWLERIESTFLEQLLQPEYGE